MANVQLKLAHPLEDVDAERVGLPTGVYYGPGAEVVIDESWARTLIAAGYGAVDPSDAKAVAAALRPKATLRDVPRGLAQPEPDAAADDPEVATPPSGAAGSTVAGQPGGAAAKSSKSKD